MGKITRARTFYLFAGPSFYEGVARVLDLGGTMEVYNVHESEQAADVRALHNDWLAVGDDLRAAIQEYGRSTRGKVTTPA